MVKGYNTAYGYVGEVPGVGKRLFATEQEYLETLAEIGDEPEFDFEKFKMECSKIKED